MKKCTLLVLGAFLLVINGIFAQTAAERQQIISNYDLQVLSQLETAFAEQFAREKQEALDLALIRGWEEFIELPNGGIAELVGVFENGAPKYYATDNQGGGITVRANRVHTGGSAGLDLNGENMLGGIWDGGRVRSTHELLNNRASQIDNPGSISNHSTHVAGTMIGNGTVQGGIAKGMSPVAELLAYDFNNDESEMTAAAATGLLVSNHSYGIPASNVPLWYLGYYDSNARNMDQITFNAPYYLPVCSAGNDRQSGANPTDGGYDYLTDKSVAKNAIICAAVFEVPNYTGPTSVNMSSFSSWGPTDDGRVKPDISAKGVNMFSSSGSSDGSYASFSGTSMATPNTSGSLLLLQQHYNALNGNYMLAATLRGLALHTADEAGTAPGPDYRFGWGLLNIETAAAVITNNGDTSLIIEESLTEGDVYTFSVQADGINDLIASITWTDPAAEVLPTNQNDLSTPSLVNDLDIRVSQDGGSTFFPWKLDPATPSAAATTGDNIVDNIEKVEVAGASGEYIIRVSHKGTLVNGSQDFSLIITGINREDFAVSTHEGLKALCATDGLTTFNIDLDMDDLLIDTINFTVTDLPAGTNGTILPPSLSVDGTVILTVDNINGLAPGDYQLKVTGTGSVETVNVYPILRILDPNAPPIVLLSPADDAIEQPLTLELTWEAGGPSAVEYEFEIALDDTFSTVIGSATTTDTSVEVSGLDFFTEYFWRVRSTNDCGDGDYSDTFSFTTEMELGINENTIPGLTVYPNPVRSLIHIDAATLIHEVTITNVLGQTLLRHAVNSNQLELDLSSLTAGHYFVQIVSEGQINVVQLIKE